MYTCISNSKQSGRATQGFTEINNRVEDALFIRLPESGEVLVAVTEGDPGAGRVPKPEVVGVERVLQDDPLGGHVVVLGGDDGVVPRPGRRGLRGGDERADERLGGNSIGFTWGPKKDKKRTPRDS